MYGVMEDPFVYATFQSCNGLAAHVEKGDPAVTWHRAELGVYDLLPWRVHPSELSLESSITTQYHIPVITGQVLHDVLCNLVDDQVISMCLSTFLPLTL